MNIQILFKNNIDYFGNLTTLKGVGFDRFKKNTSMKKQTITVNELAISITQINGSDYISLTDMVQNQEEGSKIIEKWLTNKNTIEYLGVWAPKPHDRQNKTFERNTNPIL